MREVSVTPDSFDWLPYSRQEGGFVLLDGRLLLDGWQDKLVAAVEALPEAERRVVEMVIWERVPKERLPALLGRSRSWVYRVWGRALELLRAELEGLL